MDAYRAPCAYDGERFLTGGATVLVDRGSIVAVQPGGAAVPEGWRLHEHPGASLLPGLVDTHVHLVCDGRAGALDRVEGATDADLQVRIHESLGQQLAAGVTTVRDLGDRSFAVVEHRDRRPTGSLEPTVVASGPPLTSPGGHCALLGGAVTGSAEIEAAIAERVERRVDVVKVMATGGLYSPDTDIEHLQFTLQDLQLIVDRAHAARLPVTAHAHALGAVEQALQAGVDGIEHCTCLSTGGFGGPADLLDRIAAAAVAVSLTLGTAPGVPASAPPPSVQDKLAAHGWTLSDALAQRAEWFARVCASDVRLVCGSDAGIGPAKPHGILPRAVVEHTRLGMPLGRALAGATALAADTCGLGRSKGRLRAGYDADLLLVDGDLSTDPGALLTPVRVVVGGRPAPAPARTEPGCSRPR